MPRPAVIVFDVNETLSDLSPMADRFAELGLPGQTAQVWFASLLRDGFGRTAAGSSPPFAAVSEGVLRTIFAATPPDRDVDAAIEHVMTGFASLSVHDDVVPGIRALRDAGFRLATLSVGAAVVAERLLERAGIRDAFEAVLTAADAPAWKPAAPAYGYAAEQLGVVVPHDLLLVAVHPWDIDGATRAGLRTAWITRGGGPYPAVMSGPTHTVRAVTELAPLLAGG
ncbi:MAG TPA: haloacid dehalogenase type II [Frankiaceae bacterium]|nr:haloacid dehalogenase, type [Mycobacterium sp.]